MCSESSAIGALAASALASRLTTVSLDFCEEIFLYHESLTTIKLHLLQTINFQSQMLYSN